MKSAFFILLLLLLTPALADHPPAPEQPLPDFVAPLRFGTTLDEFNVRTDRARWVTNSHDDFRLIYSLRDPAPDVPWLTLYFDADDPKPLYEFLIMYKTDSAARQAGLELFGQPNYDGEWRFTRSDGIELRAWTYQMKLIVVAVLPQTEWAESD